MNKLSADHTDSLSVDADTSLGYLGVVYGHADARTLCKESLVCSLHVCVRVCWLHYMNNVFLSVGQRHTLPYTIPRLYQSGFLPRRSQPFFLFVLLRYEERHSLTIGQIGKEFSELGNPLC